MIKEYGLVCHISSSKFSYDIYEIKNKIELLYSYIGNGGPKWHTKIFQVRRTGNQE